MGCSQQSNGFDHGAYVVVFAFYTSLELPLPRFYDPSAGLKLRYIILHGEHGVSQFVPTDEDYANLMCQYPQAVMDNIKSRLYGPIKLAE